MTNSLFIFAAAVVALLSPVIGWVICEAKAKSLMSVYFSPTQLRILSWQAKKASNWAWLWPVCGIFMMCPPDFLPKFIPALAWIALGIYAVIRMIFQFSKPCADLPKMDFPNAFIRRLAYLRRVKLGFNLLSFLMLLAVIGLMKLLAAGH